MMMTETNYAEQNAKGWLESIVEMVAALKAFDDEDREDETPVTIDGDVMESRDDVEQRIQESPLSVQVRGGWHNVGEEAEDEEFEILLTTGGPALRIIGDLGQYRAPERPRLQYQDWGTPWTEYIIPFDDPQHDEKREAIQTFCEQFYFGD